MCPEKKETKMFFCYISYKTRAIVIHSFLNKFVAKSCKHFPPHLNSVSKLPCEIEMLITHVPPTIDLLDRETREYIQPQLWSPNSSDLNPVDNSVWKILQEGVQNMHK